jgi:AcrR family transcriptional regulator
MRKKQAYHHGALRETLLAAALRSLEEDGLEALSLRALAQGAGVSKTAPYRHFADRQALLVALAAEGFRMFADALETGLAEAQPPGAHHPAEPTRSLSRAYLDFARANPTLYRLMFSRLGYGLHSETCRLNAARAFTCLQRAVAQSQAAGWRPAQEPRALALSVWAQAHGWAGLLNDGLVADDMARGVEGLGSLAGALLD